MLQGQHDPVRGGPPFELIARSSNDLDLVVSLLSMQGRKAANPQVREALGDATARVVALARARSTGGEPLPPSLPSALGRVCESLQSQAEAVGITLELKISHHVDGYGVEQISMLALIVNELATNAIKHAYRGTSGGTITIALDADPENGGAVLSVDDDGLPLTETPNDRGLGLVLVKRLAASISCGFDHPAPGSKRFVVRLPERSVMLSKR